jgi:hypothetical protein
MTTSGRTGLKLNFVLGNELLALFYWNPKNKLYDNNQARFYMNEDIQALCCIWCTEQGLTRGASLFRDAGETTGIMTYDGAYRRLFYGMLSMATSCFVANRFATLLNSWSEIESSPVLPWLSCEPKQIHLVLVIAYFLASKVHGSTSTCSGCVLEH